MELIPVITGPTGAGKSNLAIALAKRWRAEIVSADSRQIYRKMDIGTAKPSLLELASIPHHLIDERWPDESISAGEFARLAWERIADIQSRGRSALIVGGSTLYVKAITEGIANLPAGSPEIRAQLMKRLANDGSGALFDELARIDPDAAETMDPSKSQRIVRALEVYLSTGRPISDHQKDHISPPFDFRVSVLSMDRAELYDRIERRVDNMLELGLVSEVISLVEEFGSAAAPLSTIGYREIIDHLEGTHDLDTAVGLIKRNTRRYAKRQLTWYRSGADYSWFDATRDKSDTLAAYFEAGGSTA
jgi:tRNA dimethylallyltransferase